MRDYIRDLTFQYRILLPSYALTVCAGLIGAVCAVATSEFSLGAVSNRFIKNVNFCSFL